ncbi:MAG: ankyrin repeat domain-containing protein [Chthonomonadaceae bacterium]|nr:ankyrin repeat domain-containing protein [Chthonomonadaceae bacterium]
MEADILVPTGFRAMENDSLAKAAREGNAEEAVFLMAAGADPGALVPGAPDHGLYLARVTPLMIAAGSPRSNSATVQALLQGGADPKQVNEGGVSAVWFAAGGGTCYPLTERNLAELEPDHPYLDWGGGDADRLRLLLDAGGNIEDGRDQGRSAVCEACSIGDPARLKLLIDRGASVEPTKVHVPSTGLQVSPALIASLKLASGGDIDLTTFVQVPLFQAASSGSAECVRLVLAQGFPVDYSHQGDTAFQNVGSVEAAEALWEAGLRPSSGSFGRDPLDEAFESDNAALAEFFLCRTAPDRLQPVLNEKLVSCAGVRMNARGVRLLLELGADVHHVEPGLGTALHYACWQGDGNSGRDDSVVQDVVRTLLRAGSDPEWRDKHGQAALHQAVDGDWGSPTSVGELLAHGVEVDSRDSLGQTPLMLAAGRGGVECVRLLLAAGADPKARDRAWRTAIDRAREGVRIWRRQTKLGGFGFRFLMKSLGVHHDPDQDQAIASNALAEAEVVLRLLEQRSN